MLKWLVITLLVLAGFMSIMLALGYLLNENEKSTTVLKAQLEQASQAERARKERVRQRRTIIADIPKPNQLLESKVAADIAGNMQVVEQFEQIVIKNLTCLSAQQCQVVKVSFYNTDCSVVINQIGASLLKKLNTQTNIIADCPKALPTASLSCQQNICTVDR